MKENIQKLTFGVALIYICLYFMQFCRFPNTLMVFAGALICFSMLMTQKKLRIDLGICLLAVSMFSYVIIQYGMHSIITMLPYIPLVLYVLANYLAGFAKKSEDGEKKLFVTLLSCVVGCTIHGILNAYMYFAGHRVPGTRRWHDFWTWEIVPGTQHVIYFLPVLALFFVAIMYFRKRIYLNILVIVTTIFFAYTSLVTKSRTPLAILVLIFAMQIILYLLMEKETVRKNLVNKKIWITAGIMLGGIIVIVLLVKDTAVVTAFMENMSKDGGILKNARFEAQGRALQQVFDHPWGGRKMDMGLNYAHNLWLDVANVAGIIPFLGLVAYTAFTAYELIKFLFKKNTTIDIKLMMAGIYGAFFLYFTVEPTLVASVHYIGPWVFINGLIHGYLSKEN